MSNCQDHSNTSTGEENSTTYFICKCKDLESLQQCVQTGVWACQDRVNPPQPKDLLAQAHSQGNIILIYSVNKQHGWHGYVKVCFDISTENSTASCGDLQTVYLDIAKTSLIPNGALESSNQANTWHFFKVFWLKHFLDFNKQECLQFQTTQHLTLPDGMPLNKARNWQRVDEKVGQQLCCLIDEFHQKLSLQRQLREEAQHHTSYFKQEENSLASDSHGWVFAVTKVERELGKVHLVCPFGSQRYNCSTADSDQDIFILYQAKTTQMLGLDPPKQTIKNSEKETVDYTVLELQRYCELLLAGDQKSVETLFLIGTKAAYFTTLEWRELCRFQDSFLTSCCFEKYLKEATGNNGLKQLEKWKVANLDSDVLPDKLNKLAYICLRLLQNAREIVKIKSLKVYRDNDCSERKELLDIRNRKYTYTDLMILFNRILTDIQNCRSFVSNEPETDLKEILESWLIKCRLQDLEDNPYVPCDKMTKSSKEPTPTQ